MAPLSGRAGAQSTGNGFLFHEPWGGIDIRAGYAMPDANSQIFQFVTSNLTLSKRDFNSPSGEVDASLTISPRLDFMVSSGYAASSTPSEFRNFTGSDGLPIQQTTRFSRVPVTAGLRYYLTERGRQVGSFAWIPSKYAFYTGGGVGWVWSRFSQTGDFVDFSTLDVFTHQYTSSSTSAMADVFTGVDYSLNPRMALTAQAKYAFSRANMGDDWQGFNQIDLSGLAFTAGVHFRF